MDGISFLSPQRECYLCTDFPVWCFQSASAGHLWLIPEQHELKKWKFGRVDGTAAGDPKPTLNGLVSRKSSWRLRQGSREGKKDTLVRLAASKETVLKRAAVNTAQSCQNEKSAGFHTA